MDKNRVVAVLRFAVSLGLFAFLLSAETSFAAGRSECANGQGPVVKNFQGVQVEFMPTKDEAFAFGNACSAVVRDSAKKEIFSETDAGFSLVMADADVNGDGVPDLVLESYSGGAHCCWTYYIISLGANPRLLARFENERGAAFVKSTNGRIDIETQDGDFDYFDGQCHACTVFPLMYLRLEGTRFIDVGSEHVADYDEIITKSQKALSNDERQRLRSLTSNPTEDQDVDEGAAVRSALSIILAYLYSGREAEAHRALRELWPAFDQERIWDLILKKRHDGMLSYTRDKKAA